MGNRHFNINLSLGWNERFDHRIAVGIIQYARRHPDIRLYGGDWLFQVPRANSSGPDGIIARIVSREVYDRLSLYGTPIVDIANAYDTSMPKAINDDFHTGRLGAAHLFEKGYSNFAYVDVAGAEWSAERFRGMREELCERDVPGTIHRLGVSYSRFREGRGMGGLSRWLSRLPLPCGVMAANDLLGYRVTIAADMAGLGVPGDIGVVGVDDEDVYCELARPPLTSIACDCERIGMEAAELLHRILLGEDPLRRVVASPLGVTERGSTQLVTGEDAIVVGALHFIRANVGRGINVSDVSGAFPLSRRALEKRFRRVTGRTLHEEIMEARLGRACELLKGGANGVEAGVGSGFQTVSHFYHVFKEKFGVTPMEYVSDRKRYNEPVKPAGGGPHAGVTSRRPLHAAGRARGET